MTIQILVSCMHLVDAGEFLKKSNAQSDVLIVDQCDRDAVEEFDFVDAKGDSHHTKVIHTTERGLSRSRNMAIANAWCDICMISDDDEVYSDGYPAAIVNAFEQTKADVVIFKCNIVDVNTNKTLRIVGFERGEVGLRQIFKTGSWQITFMRQSVTQHNVCFDVMMGSGTGNGAGEENKFLMDCRRAGMSMSTDSFVSAVVYEGGTSQWFKGYNEKFFRDKGWQVRRTFGNVVGFLYSVYYVLSKKQMYGKDMSMPAALKAVMKGYFEKRG